MGPYWTGTENHPFPTHLIVTLALSAAPIGALATGGAALAAPADGSEFQVCTRAPNEHEAPAISLEANGDFVAVTSSGGRATIQPSTASVYGHSLRVKGCKA
jgi:hypothetical protein